jgi:hypothetical protein
MDDPKVMQKGHIDMSYRRCAQVEEPYYNREYQDLPVLQKAPEPFSSKLDAVFYVNSNCKPKIQRREIIHKLQELMNTTNSKLQVHSFGTCDRNMGPKELQELDKMGKQEFGRRYKFCVSIENNIEQDYVTEKVYHALEAGCVPIYLGAPNVDEYVPDANSIINYAQLKSPAALLAELERLAGNETAYNEKLAWKQTSIHQMAPGFQRLYEQGKTRGQCRLCQLLLEHRASPKTYTMCYANTSWRNAADSAVAKVMADLEKLPSLPLPSPSPSPAV